MNKLIDAMMQLYYAARAELPTGVDKAIHSIEVDPILYDKIELEIKKSTGREKGNDKIMFLGAGHGLEIKKAKSPCKHEPSLFAFQNQHKDMSVPKYYTLRAYRCNKCHIEMIPTEFKVKE